MNVYSAASAFVPAHASVSVGCMILRHVVHLDSLIQSTQPFFRWLTSVPNHTYNDSLGRHNW